MNLQPVCPDCGRVLWRGICISCVGAKAPIDPILLKGWAEIFPRPVRITRDEMLIRMADIVAMRSTCNRLHVGAVIAIEGRVLSIGYNGAPPGLPHCTPETCNTTTPCSRTIHAEANSVAFASRYGVSIRGASLYSTHSPCIDCAKLIISAGIREVIYRKEYRDLRPIELLLEAKIEVSQI